MRKYNFSSLILCLTETEHAIPGEQEAQEFRSDILNIKPEVRTIPELGSSTSTEVTYEHSHGKYVLTLSG